MDGATLNFEEIHAAYRGKIERYLARLVGEAEADDLTQEVFVKVHRSLAGFRGESSLSTWIYRIAANTAKDRLRAPSFRRALECDPLPDDRVAEEFLPPDPAAGMPSRESSPERQVFRKQRYECYCEILNSLPPAYRAVLALSELGDVAIEEISDRLGLNPATVKIRLHRGREKLLQALRSHCRAEDWL